MRCQSSELIVVNDIVFWTNDGIQTSSIIVEVQNVVKIQTHGSKKSLARKKKKRRKNTKEKMK